jgi:hypothetical protein
MVDGFSATTALGMEAGDGIREDEGMCKREKDKRQRELLAEGGGPDRREEGGMAGVHVLICEREGEQTVVCVWGWGMEQE